MLLIPYNTDAPVYCFPWATLGLIGANTLVTIAAVMNPEAAQAWMLEYGNGLHPLQWVTSNFIHGGNDSVPGAVMHLVGNMVFLWGFGLVVEGKVGWWRFLLIYLGIGIVQCAFEQTLMLRHQPGPLGPNGSCGASAIVFGLMAMSLVWAPKNEISVLFVFFMIRVFVYTFEVTILTFSLWHIAIEGVTMVLTGFSGSSLLHITGALVGFPLAVAMLRLGWVDCEGWDLFHVMSGTTGRGEEEIDPIRWRASMEGMAVFGRPVSSGSYSGDSPPPYGSDPDADEEDPGRPSPSDKTLRKLRKLLENGKPLAAHTEYQRLRTLLTSWRLDEPDLSALVSGLYRARAWSDVIPLLEEQIQRCPAEATKARLRLAGLVLEIQKRPTYALRILGAVPRDNLKPEAIAACEKLTRQAQRMIDDGVIELEGRSWR